MAALQGKGRTGGAPPFFRSLPVRVMVAEQGRAGEAWLDGRASGQSQQESERPVLLTVPEMLKLLNTMRLQNENIAKGPSHNIDHQPRVLE